SFRADHGRRTCMPATNRGGKRRVCIAANSAFGNRKGGRAPAIRVEGPNPLQDYVIGVLRKVIRFGSLAPSQSPTEPTFVRCYSNSVCPLCASRCHASDEHFIAAIRWKVQAKLVWQRL